MALEAARTIVQSEGLGGMTARRIAKQIGYSPGTLYNLFDNLADLIVHLNATTLDALFEACARARMTGEPEVALSALARAYIRFTAEHANLWGIIFEPHVPHGAELPGWYHDKVQRLLGLVEEALAPLFPPGQESARLHSARVMWAGLHGACSLANVGALAEAETVPDMADSLIANYVAGLRHRAQ